MSQNESMSYLSFYNLKKDPFNNPHAYSPAGKRHEMLEQLIHLNQFSHLVLGVVAPKGYGKTTLFQLLNKQLQHQSDIQLFSISPNGPVTGLDLLQQVAMAWQLEDVSDDRETLLRKLRMHNLSHSSVGIRHCIIIDNADKIGDEGLLTLQDLVSGLPEEQAIGLTLFCEEGKSDLRAIYQPIDSLHLVHMTALSNKDVFSFIQDHFIAAGHKQGLPFSPELIEKIYIASEGIPAKIKTITTDYMIAQASESVKKPSTGFPKLHIYAVSALVTVILGSVIYQVFNSEGAAPKQTRTEISLPASTISEKLKSAASQVEARQENNQGLTIGKATDNIGRQEESNDSVLIELPIDLNKATDKTAEQNVLSEDAIEASALVENPLTSTSISTAEPLNKTPSDESTSSVSAETTDVASVEVRVTDTKPKTWLEQAGLNEFTIQMLGASTEKAVKEFIASQNRPASFHYHKTMLKGKDWYIVTYGIYAQKENASDAIKLLPSSLKKHSPWVRSIQSIRDAM